MSLAVLLPVPELLLLSTEMNPLNPAFDGPVALTPHKNEWPRDRKTDQDDRNVRPRIGGPEPRPPVF